MILKTLTLRLESDKQITENAHQLRGFFAAKFNEYVLLHQHKADKFVYKYPLIQYKMIDSIPTIISINEGTEVLKEIYDGYDSLKLGGHEYRIFQREIIIKEQKFGVSDSIYEYQFLTPWLALNEKNYEKYTKFGTWEKKKTLLGKILIGNIISMSKSLGYTVPEPIKVNILNLNELKTSLKGVPMLGFLGDFSVNFEIPDYFGLGKSVSRGFGTIIRRQKTEDRRQMTEDRRQRTQLQSSGVGELGS